MKTIDLIFRVHPMVKGLPYFGMKADIKMGEIQLDKITPELIEEIKNNINIEELKGCFIGANDYKDWNITILLDDPEDEED